MEMEEQRRAARVKRIHEAMDKRMNERVSKAMDKRMNERVSKAMDKRMNERMDEGMRKRDRERMERRWDWYARVGINRDFARDYAKYMAGMSC